MVNQASGQMKALISSEEIETTPSNHQQIMSFKPSSSKRETTDDMDPYGSDDENENSEVIEQLFGEEKELFDKAYVAEKQAHPFTEYYKDPKIDYNFAKNIRAVLENYTQDKALKYMAKSHVWHKRDRVTQIVPPAPCGNKAVRQFVFVDNIHAIYRVISIKKDKYILLACHLNVHGFYRGDLRFVEVNSKTKTNSSKYSCIGHLAHGDLVAVTELAKTEYMPEVLEKMDVYKFTQETPCVWMVKNMTLLKRQKFQDVPFAFLENGTAVALKWGQVLTVKNKDSFATTQNLVFTGKGFIPEKVPEFAAGLTAEQLIPLVGLTREITKYPLSTGTIFEHEYSSHYTTQMEFGLDAYSSNLPDPDGIVELCALMGATAVTAIFNGSFDCRSFKMIDPKRDNDLLIFHIENVQEPKPEGLWKVNTRIIVGSTKMNANAVIETVFMMKDELRITARLSREHYNFHFTDDIHMVSQREMPEGKGLRDGFLETIPYHSNGRRIISALYGGFPIVPEPLYGSNQYIFPGTDPLYLNKYQNEYVNRLLQKTPITLANSPFGCGKSMTIATAAFYAVIESRRNGKGEQQLLVTQSNFASVNLVDITKKYKNECKVIRYVSENNWMELPEEGRTELDLPLQMQHVFVDYVTGIKDCHNDINLFQMAIFLKERINMNVEDMNSTCQNFFRLNENARKYDFFRLTRVFFQLVRPEIVITTSDSLRSVLPNLHHVKTVQFDEASQVPECALIQVLSTFPHAYFGLVGDIQQLPPYCDILLTGHLKKYGIGNTMERAIKDHIFPEVGLCYVYRCHPATTELLGSLFYNGRLISGVTHDDRGDLMSYRPDIWPSRTFPIMIWNNTAPSERVGTSMQNPAEVLIVRQIVYSLTSPTYNHSYHPSKVGIISFYKAQTCNLIEQFRDMDIKCGTVDSFQGMEREIMILCCTNEIINGFLANKNRINVALSRAKQTTFIVGNVSSLRDSFHWKAIVEKTIENGCIKNAL